MRQRARLPEWLGDSALLLETFVAINLAFLALDIYLAHAVNEFRHPAEWIPFYFSIAGAVAIIAVVARTVAVVIRGRARPGEMIAAGGSRMTGLIVGWAAVIVGVAGFIWHLQSSFFQEATLKSLVYSAPFIAPLAYAGVGFLLLANRLTPHGTREWASWVLFLAWCGFVGNFGLSLLDHAQNGFFYWTEWISVAVSTTAVGFTFVLIFDQENRNLLMTTIGVLILQAVTGMVGFGLHLRPLLTTPSSSPLFDRVIFGAPLLAPLLFINLALLAGIGVWEIWRQNHGPGDVIEYGQSHEHEFCAAGG